MVLKIKRWFWFLLLTWRLSKAIKIKQVTNVFEIIMFKIRHTPRELFLSNPDYLLNGELIVFDNGFNEPADYVRVGDDLTEHMKRKEYIPTSLLDHVYNRRTIGLKEWLENGPVNSFLSADVAIYIFTIIENMESELKKLEVEDHQMYVYYERRIKGFMEDTQHLLEALLKAAYHRERV